MENLTFIQELALFIFNQVKANSERLDNQLIALQKKIDDISNEKTQLKVRFLKEAYKKYLTLIDFDPTANGQFLINIKKALLLLENGQ